MYKLKDGKQLNSEELEQIKINFGTHPNNNLDMDFNKISCSILIKIEEVDERKEKIIKLITDDYLECVKLLGIPTFAKLNSPENIADEILKII